jgi:NADH dehydrogenase
VLPLACANAKFAPVYVGDVVEAIARSLHDRAAIGEVYELYGPDVFSLREIVAMSARQLGLRRWSCRCRRCSAAAGFRLRLRAGQALLSDNCRSLQTDSVGGIDGLHRLGVPPTPCRRYCRTSSATPTTSRPAMPRLRAMH